MTPLEDLYTVEILDHGDLNPTDDNVDVFVNFADGRKYVATFFTIANIRTIMHRHRASGESAGGAYFWAADAVIVETLDRETIEKAVADLIESGEFETAFDGPHQESPGENE